MLSYVIERDSFNCGEEEEEEDLYGALSYS